MVSPIFEGKHDYRVLHIYARFFFGNLHGKADSTRAYYLANLKSFLDFIDARKSFDVQAFSDFRDYLVNERNDLSHNARKNYYYSARKFLKTLYEKGMIKADLTFFVPPPPKIEKPKETPPAEPLHSRPKPRVFWRKRVAELLCVEMGLKAVASLNVEDIDLTQKNIRFTRNKKEKTLEISHELKLALESYLRLYPRKQGRLFTRLSNNGKDAPLSDRALYALLHPTVK